MSITIEKLLHEAEKVIPDFNQERILDAFQFAEGLHKGQKRLSGEPYIIHPLAVAYNLLSLHPDEDTVIAALLHDVLEDTDIEPKEIEKRFGKTVLKLAQGVEKIQKIHLQGKDRQIGSLRKLFLAMAEDLRVIFIKLADRLHNMETLTHMKPEKQRRMAEETLNVYAPIAGRLGIYHFKIPLEDLSFRYLYPKEFKRLSKELESRSSMRERKMIRLKENLEKTLKKTQIKFEIHGRVKHLYSVYKKLEKQTNESLDEIYDIFALRIIVPTTGDCYAVLGEIHKHWTPLSYRFKDYIAVPKPNGYQSLHTTVIGVIGGRTPQPVEVQIRTQEMHQESEYGVAAHWIYKEDATRNKTKWVQGLVDLEQTLQDNIEFEENLRQDTFGDRIFVLTPNGDVKDLPQDATPIDFAYAIHTEIGNHCTGAKVNDKIVPLDHPLENGDVVGIIINKKNAPNQFWLNFVVTSHAKQRIRAWFRSQDTDKLIKAGKELLNKQLIRLGHNELDPHLLLLKNYEKKSLPLKEREFLLEKIGNGSLSPTLVIKKLFPEDRLLTPRIIKKDTRFSKRLKEEKAKVVISGEDLYKTKLSSCCQPGEGDSIVGYVTRGDYISVHKRVCKIIQNMKHRERLIAAHWSTEKIKHRIKLEMNVYDKVGLIRDIAHVFATHKVNILGLIVDDKRAPDGSHKITFTIEIGDEGGDRFNHVLNRIESVEGVESVKRLLEKEE